MLRYFVTQLMIMRWLQSVLFLYDVTAEVLLSLFLGLTNQRLCAEIECLSLVIFHEEADCTFQIHNFLQEVSDIQLKVDFFTAFNKILSFRPAKLTFECVENAFDPHRDEI